MDLDECMKVEGGVYYKGLLATMITGIASYRVCLCYSFRGIIIRVPNQNLGNFPRLIGEGVTILKLFM